MQILTTILLVAAFVLFVLSAIGIPSPNPPRFHLIAAGLACWVLSVILGGMHVLSQ